MTNQLIGTIVIVLMLPLTFSLFLANRDDQPEVVIARAAETAIAVEADGEVEADDIIDLSFVVGGTVHDLYVSEGNFVREGDPIAILENERERVAVARAEVSLAILELQREDLLEISEDDIRLAEARIQSARDNYGYTNNQLTQQDIRAAELQLEQAQSSLDAAERARIFGGGSMNTDSDPDDGINGGNGEGVQLLEAQRGEATFDAEIARLQLEDLRTANSANLGAAGAQIRQAEAELQSLLAGPTDFQVTDANLAIEDAQHALQQADANFERTVLRAPTDGVIANVDIEVGQQVQPRVGVMQLVDMQPVHITLEVDEIDLRRLEPGMDTLVTLDALPGYQFDASITSLSLEGEEIDGVVVYEVTVDLTNPDPRLLPGMSATARVLAPGTEDVITVPQSAIRMNDDGTRTVVVVNDDGTTDAVTVQLGNRRGTDIEIVSGLAAGDAVVVTQ